jgi:hypothetical protein
MFEAPAVIVLALIAFGAVWCAVTAVRRTASPASISSLAAMLCGLLLGLITAVVVPENAPRSRVLGAFLLLGSVFTFFSIGRAVAILLEIRRQRRKQARLAQTRNAADAERSVEPTGRVCQVQSVLQAVTALMLAALVLGGFGYSVLSGSGCASKASAGAGDEAEAV